MKRNLVIILLILLSFNLYSQDSEKKGFIGITIGPSIPIGDFADKSQDNSDAGFANTGLNINLINFGYRFGKNLGLAASWFGTAYTANIIGEEIMWSLGGLLVGPMYYLPVDEKINFNLKCMIGFTAAQFEIIELNEGESSELGFGFDLGASTHFNLSEKWC